MPCPRIHQDHISNLLNLETSLTVCSSYLIITQIHFNFLHFSFIHLTYLLYYIKQHLPPLSNSIGSLISVLFLLFQRDTHIYHYQLSPIKNTSILKIKLGFNQYIFSFYKLHLCLSFHFCCHYF